MDSPITSVKLSGARASFDTVALWALSLTLALGAVVLIPSSSVPFLYTKISLFAIGGIVSLVLYILARLTHGNVIVPPLPLLGALWLPALAYGLSTLFSGKDLLSALFGTELESDTFGFILLLSFLGTLVALIIRRPSHYHTFFRIGFLAFVLVAVLQTAIFIIGESAPGVVSPTLSLVGSFGDLSMFFGLGITLAMLALRFLDLGKWEKIALFVYGAVALAFIFLVNSLLIWILLGLASLGLFVELVMSRRHVAKEDSDLDGASLFADDETVTTPEEMDTRASFAAPLAVLAIALFVIIGGSTLAGSLNSALGVNLVDVRPSWQSTFAVGSHTYASSPLLGSGPGTFGQEWLKFRDPALNNTIFWNVDFTSGIGFIPTSFITTGALGVVAWVLLLGLFLVFGLRALIFRIPSDTYLRFVSVGSYVGAWYVFLLAIFSVPGPVILILGFALAGLFVSSMRYGAGKRKWGVIFTRSPRMGFVIVFALTLLLFASIAAVYTVVEHYVGAVEITRAGNALSLHALDKADAAVTEALVFAPNGAAYRLQSVIGMNRLQAIAGDTTLSAEEARTKFQSTLSSAIQSALTATRVSGGDYHNWLALGDVYALVVPLGITGAYENAKTAYEHAMVLNPTNPTIALTLAQLEVAHKDLDAARIALTKAITLKGDYTQAIFLLSQVEVAAGRTKDALAAAEAAAYFAPNDSSALFQVGILRLASGDAKNAIAALAHAVSVNPQYANARYFLAVAYARLADYPSALAQLQAIAALSDDNKKAVASDMAALSAGKNPFPASLGSFAGTAPLSGK